MPNFAVIENDVVVNIILADTQEIANQVTNKECVQYADENPIGIGWIRENGTFVAPKLEGE